VLRFLDQKRSVGPPDITDISEGSTLARSPAAPNANLHAANALEIGLTAGIPGALDVLGCQDGCVDDQMGLAGRDCSFVTNSAPAS
jgi:hypothetical protein